MYLADWQSIVSQLRSCLDQASALLSGVPEDMALAALLVPVALATLSKRLMVVLGSLLLSATAFCTFVAPSNSPATLAIGIYLGGLFVALSGIVTSRKARIYRDELAGLRSDVNQLLHSDQRRLLTEIRSGSIERNESVSTTRVSKDSPA